MEAGSQGPIGILNRQDALVPSSPSLVVLRKQVASDSPGSLLGCGEHAQRCLPRARRVKTVNLEADFAREAYKRPSATLVGNCQLGSLTTGSPAGHLLLRARIQG